jgi:hypothetical protein
LFQVEIVVRVVLMPQREIRHTFPAIGFAREERDALRGGRRMHERGKVGRK